MPRIHTRDPAYQINRLTWAARRAGRNRHLEYNERRRHERVIADEAGQVDHLALAEALFDQAVIDGMVAIARGRQAKSLELRAATSLAAMGEQTAKITGASSKRAGWERCVYPVALIYSGYPRAHEDDAERAVRAGLAVIEAIGKLPSREDLSVRLGIATGLVVVGDLIGEGAAQERGVSARCRTLPPGCRPWPRPTRWSSP